MGKLDKQKTKKEVADLKKKNYSRFTVSEINVFKKEEKTQQRPDTGSERCIWTFS